jgi:alpha-maltose-1-phosphate synthase
VSHVPFHEVHTLFQAADVFVYPSLHEGSAFAIYEALASGLPIVTTPNAARSCATASRAFVVPIRDVDALVERIERLHRDPDLRRSDERSGARARARLHLGALPAARRHVQLDAWLAERATGSGRMP